MRYDHLVCMNEQVTTYDCRKLSAKQQLLEYQMSNELDTTLSPTWYLKTFSAAYQDIMILMKQSCKCSRHYNRQQSTLTTTNFRMIYCTLPPPCWNIVGFQQTTTWRLNDMYAASQKHHASQSLTVTQPEGHRWSRLGTRGGSTTTLQHA